MGGIVLLLLCFLSSGSPVDWRAVIEGCPVSLWMFLGWRSPLCIDPALFGGCLSKLWERGDLELQRALDGLFPVSGGSVEKDCFEIGNK